jgi:hypothetical protein
MHKYSLTALPKPLDDIQQIDFDHVAALWTFDELSFVLRPGLR